MSGIIWLSYFHYYVCELVLYFVLFPFKFFRSNESIGHKSFSPLLLYFFLGLSHVSLAGEMERFFSTMSLHLFCLLLLTSSLQVGRADEEEEIEQTNTLQNQLTGIVGNGKVRELHQTEDVGLHRITLSTWKDLHQQTTPVPTQVTRLYGPFRKVLRSQLPFDQEVPIILQKDTDTRLVYSSLIFFHLLPSNMPNECYI